MGNRLLGRSAALDQVVLFVLLSLFTSSASAQSTFGSVLGTVHDPSGATIVGSIVTVTNDGTSATRSTITDQSGSYSVPNLEPGTYTVSMKAPGFQVSTYKSIELLARETVRLDANLSVASQTESVNVTSEIPVINSEVSNLAETKTGRELVDLPVAIASRGSGSTSPFSTLTTQPGVQTDASGNISVAGTKPAMLSVTIDGISSVGPRTSAPLAELFPSFNSIAEIRVSEINNSAEFGGISDITTISKSGNNNVHGGIFENFQNTVLNARNPFSKTVPKLNMNDFGFFLGGPVMVPKLYNGRNKTFFFMAYEGLRLAKQTVLTESVPSLALRSGDLSAYSTPVYRPGTGQAFRNNQIPVSQISPISLQVLQHLFPLPNTGAPNSISNNYVQNFPTPIGSNQGDMRLDQNITSKQTVFARFTYKHRDVTQAPDPSGTNKGSALLGAFSLPEIDYGLSVAYNWIIKPTLLNEVRTGFNGVHSALSFNANPSQYVTDLGLGSIPLSVPAGNAVPNFNITGFAQTGGTASRTARDNTFQIIDNLTWNRGSHTLKFGGDYRYLTGYRDNVYGAFRLGQYTYNGSITNLGLNGQKADVARGNPPYIGNAFAGFLLGIPDSTQIDSVIQPNSDGYARAYAFYAQDDWKATPRLTVNFGLRWEYHPMFKDKLLNSTNFLPDYQSIINGQQVNGAMVIMNQDAFKILDPQFAASVAPTPILTAQQAGIPESLRYSQKTDFAPRIGFAWRPFADGKTVVRGGYGRFIEGPLGALLGAAYAIHSAFQGIYTNSFTGPTPALAFPNPFPAVLAQPGVQFFQQAGDLHFKDPIVQQWNFTLERDLGFGTGLQLSYYGSHSSDLGVQGDLNQLAPNTIGFNAAKRFAKYPLWAEIETETNGGFANYNALSATLNKRFSKGLQFQSNYTFTRNLTDAQGWNPSAFASEAGGAVTTLSNVRLDYGNVAYTRRNRFLTTFLYQLPLGRGGMFLNHANGLVDRLVGGWQLAGVVLFQSGPFLTVTAAGTDPSGTGFPTLFGNGRADVVPGVSLSPVSQSVSQWINPAAFAIPASNIGRFGTSPIGNLQGPGTQAVSLSLMKAVRFTEQLNFQIGAQVGNVFNHPNYAPPGTTLGTASFGTISNVQSAEGAGPRNIQITARLNF